MADLASRLHVECSGGTIAPFDDAGERIYAAMITGKSRARIPLARASVQSFCAQTYGNRALVIVNDGDFDLVIPGVPADRIIHLRPTRPAPLGVLRNCALDALPEGAVWTYWDDDDWHHPRVLAAQYRVLSQLGVDACLLCNQVKYGLAINSAFVDRHPGGFAGTLMGRTRRDLRFPETAKGEDSAYTAAIKQTCRWYPWNNPAHYFLRFYHGTNTWDDRHFRLDGLAPGQWRVPAAAADYLSSILPLYGEASMPTTAGSNVTGS